MERECRFHFDFDCYFSLITFKFPRKSYYPPDAYNQSKLAQVLFTRHLQNLFNQDVDLHVQIHAVHPGVVDTDLFVQSSTYIPPWFKKLFFKVKKKQKIATYLLNYDGILAKCLIFRILKKELGLLYMPLFPLELRVGDDHLKFYIP